METDGQMMDVLGDGDMNRWAGAGWMGEHAKTGMD